MCLLRCSVGEYGREVLWRYWVSGRLAMRDCSSFLSSLHSVRKPFRVNIPSTAPHGENTMVQ